MDFESVLRLGLGLCLLVALGASANTLDGALSTDPSEVVDVDEETIPISEDDVGDLRAAVTGDREDGESAQARREGAGDHDGTQRVARNRGRNADNEAGASGPERARRSSEGADGSSGGASDATTADRASGERADQPSLLERLLALLERLLPLVAGLAVLGALVALRSYVSTGPSSEDAADDGPDLVADPEDAVSAAWYDMARELGYGDDPSVTPRELVRAAADTDVDAPVRTLTDLYEATRYGGQSVTDERVRRARETLQEFRRTRIDGGGG